MNSAGLSESLPLAATMDLQYRLPPFQQIFFNTTIIISIILLGVAIAVMLYLSQRAKAKAKIESRLDALRMAEKILRKRGGQQEDVNRMLAAFKSHPGLDPAAMVMIRERFHDEMLPVLEREFGSEFAERMEKTYFPPPKDTRQAIGAPDKELQVMVEETKTQASGQAAAAILDLMDATLRPGVVTRIVFGGMEGGHECLVMGHDMGAFNVTLPANNPLLVGSIKAGMTAEGTLECGPSLLAYTSTVIQAVAGSMPYCRLSAWKTAWEVRKRESVRLPLSLDIDFQHISVSAGSIKMSSLDKEIGTVRPGRLTDLSLGGCGIETPSSAVFAIGDMIRFSRSLVAGNPPVTLLGAVVKVDAIDPAANEGCSQSLHIQFLVIDDVSQRILVRTMRQLQDIAEREEWMQAQQLLQMMRRNKIQSIGSPAPVRRDSTSVAGKAPSARATGPAGTRGGSGSRQRPSTRSIPKPPPRRPSTRSLRRPPD